MLRYSAVTTPLYVPIDLTGAEVVLSVEQGYVNISKYVTPEYNQQEQRTYVSMFLTQEETAKFKADKPAKIMVNWIFQNEQRSGSAVAIIPVFENLYRKVMHYGDRPSP